MGVLRRRTLDLSGGRGRCLEQPWFGFSIFNAMEFLFPCEKINKRSVKANRRMLRVDLSFASPGQVNDGESVWLVFVVEQYIILIFAICDCLDRSAVQQMAWRKLALKLRVEALRDGSIREVPSPSLQCCCTIWRNASHLHA